MTSSPAPIITLTSDFGLADSYVAEMKGAILSRLPAVVLVDVSHDVPPHDVEAGAYLLQRAVPAFPAGTVHLAVVDPGVGSARRGLVLAAAGQWLVGPDNGLLGPFLAGSGAWSLDAARLATGPVSATFHGRDLFAPAAARLAAGEEPDAFATPVADPVRPEATPRPRILHVDRFGNCVTNLAPDRLPEGGWILEAGGHAVRRRVSTYADAPPGEPVLILGSAGLLEIALREESAAARLGLRRGQPVHLSSSGDAPSQKGTRP